MDGNLYNTAISVINTLGGLMGTGTLPIGKRTLDTESGYDYNYMADLDQIYNDIIEKVEAKLPEKINEAKLNGNESAVNETAIACELIKLEVFELVSSFKITQVERQKRATPEEFIREQSVLFPDLEEKLKDKNVNVLMEEFLNENEDILKEVLMTDDVRLIFDSKFNGTWNKSDALRKDEDVQSQSTENITQTQEDITENVTETATESQSEIPDLFVPVVFSADAEEPVIK